MYLSTFLKKKSNLNKKNYYKFLFMFLIINYFVDDADDCSANSLNIVVILENDDDDGRSLCGQIFF